MNCKYYRTRTEKNIKYGYCLKDKKKVPLFCKECEEYKKTIEEKLKISNNNPLKHTTNCHTSSNLRQKSKKLTKLEKNRFSILTNDLEHCIICGYKKDNLHEIFFGTANRTNSMKYGCVIPLCLTHHTEMHKNKEWQEYWHQKAQLSFIKEYPDLDFLEVFKKNYL